MRPAFQLARNQSFHYYIFITDQQQHVFISRYYTSEKACRKGIAELQTSVRQHSLIEKIAGTSGSFSFIIRDKKKDILGHSAEYFAVSSREVALRSLIAQCPNAAVVIANSFDARACTDKIIDE